MAVARVSGHDANGASATSSLTVNYPGATTAGNLLVALVFSNVTSDTLTVSGWQTTSRSVAGATVGVFYKVSTGDSSVAATSASASIMQMHVYEYSGFPRAFVVDAAVTATGSAAASHTTAAITTTVAADLLIFACVPAGGTITAATWATATTLQANTQNRMIAGQYIPGAIQTALTATASWTTSRTSASVVVAFTPRSGGDFFAFFN